MGLMDEVDETIWAAAFTNADAFPGVESVTYTPDGGNPTVISVPVFRDPPLPDLTTGVVARRLRIFVAATQIDSVAPNDRVTIAFDRGGAAKQHAVKQILSQDAGGWMLLLG